MYYLVVLHVIKFHYLMLTNSALLYKVLPFFHLTYVMVQQESEGLFNKIGHILGGERGRRTFIRLPCPFTLLTAGATDIIGTFNFCLPDFL